MKRSFINSMLILATLLALTFSVLGTTPARANIDASSFAAKVDFSTGAYPASVAIGDLDGDGKPDLVAANFINNTISVFRNASTSGTIDASSFAAKVDFSAGSAPYSVAIGDLDGDGKPDLVVASRWIDTVSVFRNTSTSGTIDASSFAAKVDFSTGTYPNSVAIGDLDGDDKPDLAVANLSSSTISVFRNTSTSGTIDASSFAAKVDFSAGAAPASIAISDLDGDNKSDLAVANLSSSTVSVFRNTSTSGIIDASSFAAKVDFSAGSAPYSIAIGDLDGDTKPDLAVANLSSSTVSVFRNTSTSGIIDASSFAAKVDFSAGSAPYSIAIGDLDGDTKPDLATTNYDSNTVSAFRNTSTSGTIDASSFAAKVDFSTGTTPMSVAIGDLDGDGKPDLALANFHSNTVSVMRNTTAPAVNLNPTTWNFGDQAVGTTSGAKQFTLTNTGTENLIIGALEVTGEFGLNNDLCSGQTVAPSGTCTFDVAFSPLSAGAKAGSVSIPSNAPTAPDTVSLSGNGYYIELSSTFHSVGAYDGYIIESGENTSAGGTAFSTGTTMLVGDHLQDRQLRAILHFNTATLPDNAVITKVTLKIKKQGLTGTNPFTILGGLKVDMCKPFFDTNVGLGIGDFQAAAGVSSVATFDPTPVSNWYSALLNAAGRAYVNLTGTAQFRLRFAMDDNDNNAADYMEFFSGDYVTASARPTLIVTYYIP